jgi:hypothetical protein
VYLRDLEKRRKESGKKKEETDDRNLKGPDLIDLIKSESQLTEAKC